MQGTYEPEKIDGEQEIPFMLLTILYKTALTLHSLVFREDGTKTVLWNERLTEHHVSEKLPFGIRLLSWKYIGEKSDRVICHRSLLFISRDLTRIAAARPLPHHLGREQLVAPEIDRFEQVCIEALRDPPEPVLEQQQQQHEPQVSMLEAAVRFFSHIYERICQFFCCCFN